MTDELQAPEGSIRFIYTNWRGETAERHATPTGIRWDYTDWHPEPGWLMRAFDHDKGALRDFALKDCVFRTSPEAEVGKRFVAVSDLADLQHENEKLRDANAALNAALQILSDLISEAAGHHRDAALRAAKVLRDLA